MRVSHALGFLATLALAIVLANCSGGGHATIPAGQPAAGLPAGNGGSATQSITITINIPGSSTNSTTRRTAYVGSGTKSATFSATVVSPGVAPTPSATVSANCTTTCSATLTGIPVGMVSFTVNLYDQPVGTVPQGYLLSTGTATFAITPSTTSENLTFNGVPETVQITTVPNPIPNTANGNIQAAMAVQDADGNTIVGPGLLNSPYTFTSSAGTHVTLAPAPVASPGQALTLAYDGTLSTGSLVQLYSTNAAINGGHPITAGSVLIGSAPATPTPSQTALPAPSPMVSGNFPIVFVNNSGISGAANVYVFGKLPADNATYEYVNGSGGLTPFASGTSIPAIALPSGSGEVDVPMLCSARIYVAIGGTQLTITGSQALGVNPPAPWSGTGTGAIFDLLEYTWTNQNAPECPATNMGLDETAVDAIGIPLSFQLEQAGPVVSSPVGLMPYAGTSVAIGLNALGGLWPSLVQTYTPTTKPSLTLTRIVNPTHAIVEQGQSQAPFNFPPNYLAAYMNAVCQAYTTTDLHIGGTDHTGAYFIPSPGPHDVYGRYANCGTPNQTLTFYAMPNMQGSPVANATFTGVPSTVDALGNAGYFAPAADPGLHIGRILAVSISRSTLLPNAANPVPTAQPDCTAAHFYGGTTTNAYSALAHANAYGNSTYAFADDDECSLYAPYVNVPAMFPAAGTAFVVTINPF
jgi:hypothetical protein